MTLPYKMSFCLQRTGRYRVQIAAANEAPSFDVASSSLAIDNANNEKENSQECLGFGSSLSRNGKMKKNLNGNFVWLCGDF